MKRPELVYQSGEKSLEEMKRAFSCNFNHTFCFRPFGLFVFYSINLVYSERENSRAILAPIKIIKSILGAALVTTQIMSGNGRFRVKRSLLFECETKKGRKSNEVNGF